MVRPGKKPALPPADDTTQVTTQGGRWRAGINRQSQPSAHSSIRLQPRTLQLPCGLRGSTAR